VRGERGANEGREEWKEQQGSRESAEGAGMRVGGCVKRKREEEVHRVAAHGEGREGK
jgi:hypothetical protein